MKRLLAVIVVLFAALSLQAERLVYPVRDRMVLESLNGTWDFRFTGDASWRKCVVPGCWETQGLARPSYSTGISSMTGEYRRVFAYNPAWKGRHVFIRFDGVMYGYALSVNGRKAGEADSAYNLHQFDITDFLKAGENNISVTLSLSNATGISQVRANVTTSKAYTLQGTLAQAGVKGIVIQSGKKIVK